MDTTHGTLAGIGQQIRARYRTLANSDAVENPKWAALDNEMQRFELWARNLGLYTGGHSSLDYRFRDAQLLFDHTLELLQDLARLLAQSLKLVTGDISQEEEEEEDSSEDSEDEDDASYQNMPLFEILTDSAGATIDRLYRLVFKIRNPSMRLGGSRALEYREVDQSTGIDLMKQFVALDEQYIQDLLLSYGHSHADNHYLIPRLAKANTRRRQQFRYWRKRRDAFERLSTTDLVDEHDDKRPEPVAEERQNLLVPGQEPIVMAPSQPSTATWLNPEKVKLDDDMSAISTVSYIYSSAVQGGDCVSLPAPPKLSPEAKEFECPYCFTICPRKLLNKRNWEAHILRDLRPYICTYRHCKAPDQPYDSMSDWINHENTNHRIKGPNENGNQMPHIEHDASRNCPFCLVPAASPMHVASHLHRVASFALPRSGGDEDMQDGSKQSDQTEVRTRESELSGVTLSNGTGDESGNDLSSSGAEHVSSFSLEDLRKIGTGNDTELSNVHSFLGALNTGSSFDSATFDTLPDDGSQSKGHSGETTAGDVPKEAPDGNLEPPIDDHKTGKDEGPGEIPAQYDATDDALALRDALGQADVNTKTLIQVLPYRTHAEILELRKGYKNCVRIQGKGVNLAKHIHVKLHNSALAKACYATAVGRWESESYWASYCAVDSSYYHLLIESFLGRSNSEIHYIKESFKGRRYDSYYSLEGCINGRLKAGKFRTAVLLALKGSRQSENDPIDPELVASDVQALHSALRQGDGDEMAMIYIIVRRSDSHLREVIRTYQNLHEQNVGREIIHKIRNVVGELLAHVLNGAINQPLRDALLLHEALWESRSDNERSILLISRLVRLHWEPQHLVSVKEEYHHRYDQPLEDAIAEEILQSSGGSEWGEFCIQLLRSSEMHAVKA